MKAISLYQPWASLIALGLKRIETRGWLTHYRGPLAIHATNYFPPLAKMAFREGRIWEALSLRGLTDWRALPRGAVLCIADLVDCERIGPAFVMPPDPELSFGDFRPSRYAWRLANVRPLREPFYHRGGQRIWSIDDRLLEGLACVA